MGRRYRDFSNGATPRNCTGYGGNYSDDTGNNEIILSKCAHDAENITTLAEYIDGEFEIVSNLTYKLENDEFMLGVPKEKLNISADSFGLEFKWADSKTRFDLIDDFYTKGHCAPIGRLNFAF